MDNDTVRYVDAAGNDVEIDEDHSFRVTDTIINKKASGCLETVHTVYQLPRMIVKSDE